MRHICILVPGPHPPHEVEVPDASSWHCDGVPEPEPQSPREVMEKAVGGRIESK